MWGRRLRRRSNIEPALGKRLVFAGLWQEIYSHSTDGREEGPRTWCNSDGSVLRSATSNERDNQFPCALRIKW